MKRICLLALLLAVPATLRAQDPIVFNAVSAGTLEAPMEKAAATNVPLEIRDSLVKGAAGESWLQILQGKGNPPDVPTGKAVYSFTVPEDGDYILWFRVWWIDQCGNSFFVHLDDAKDFIFGEDSTFKTWHWVKAPARIKQLTLTKGTHTLTVKNREDGVALNQILLTTDKEYVPVDVETVTAAPAKAAP